MRKRLDQALFERGLASSRARARDLILRGEVRVDGAVTVKPATLVTDGADLGIAAAKDYVSRGGIKLATALDAFGFDPGGRVALDIGASTGGFVEVLLARGAVKIYAVDVGRGQLHARLRTEFRVVALESCDARDLTRDLVLEPVGAIVADVSFISLTKALPRALALAAPGAWLVALIKPQFEVGPENVGKRGIVRDEKMHDLGVGLVSQWFAATPGWRIVGIVPSPIEGGSGNREFLLGARFDG